MPQNNSFLVMFFSKLAVGIVFSLLLGFSPSAKATDIDLTAVDSIYAIFIAKNDYVGGLKYTETQLEEALDTYGKTDTIYARILCHSATFHFYISKFEIAEQQYLEALNIQEQLLEYYHPHYAFTLNNLASLYFEMGKFEAVEPLLQQALEIDKHTEGEESYTYSSSLVNLAVIYTYLNRYEEAEPLLKQAIEIRGKTSGVNHIGYANALNNLGDLYRELKDYEKVEPLYLKSIEIAKKLLPNHPNDYSFFLSNLALFYTDTKQYSKSEKLYIQALSIQKKQSGKLSSTYSQTLHNLASLYFENQEYEKAKTMYLEVFHIDSVLFGKEHNYHTFTLNNLAQIHLAQKDLAKALTYNLKTLDIMSNCSLQNLSISAVINKLDSCTFNVQQKPIGTLILLQKILYEYYKQEKDPKWLELCYAYALRTNHLLDRSRKELLYEKDKLSFLKKSNVLNLLNMYFTYQLYSQNKDPQYIEAGFQLAEHSRAVVLMDALKTQQAKNFGNVPDSLIQRQEILNTELFQIKTALLEINDSTEKALLQNQLNSIYIALNDYNNRLQKHYPKHYNSQYQSKPINTKELQQKLNTNQALIEYFLADSILYIFVCKQQSIDFVGSLDQAELDQDCQQLHESLNNYALITEQPKLSYQSYTKPAYTLYLQLIVPLKPYLENIEHLTIIPDGPLNSIPFEVLLSKEVPTESINYGQLPYLLNTYSINYSYSSALLLENYRDKSPKKNHQFLGMAASYQYKVSQNIKRYRNTNAQQQRKVLSELPSIRKEVSKLQQFFEGKFLFDSLSNEQTFKKIAPQYNIIHLAMHGLVNNQYPILSSLAFTENGDTTEDNFLYAYEISQMKLNAELVVLSACETGKGKFETGEGVFSLARAFMYAGVPSLVVSLWQVNDYSSSVLMRMFYKNLAKDMNLAKALQEAKKSYLKQSKGLAQHPAFWAAFVQLGDSSPSYIRNKNTRMLGYYILIGAALLVWTLISRSLYKRRKLAKREQN
ncbi:MAG: CHAT domain-containing protein [Aureispira sp.]|nr:CHAT domain-containing protein [Aureispira sp.]